MKTEFGYHIIKLVDRKPAVVRSAQAIRRVNNELSTQCRARACRTAGRERTAEAIAAEARNPQALEKVVVAVWHERRGVWLLRARRPHRGAWPATRRCSMQAFDLADNTVERAGGGTHRPG